jgi:hypothetical protein
MHDPAPDDSNRLVLNGALLRRIEQNPHAACLKPSRSAVNHQASISASKWLYKSNACVRLRDQ